MRGEHCRKSTNDREATRNYCPIQFSDPAGGDRTKTVIHKCKGDITKSSLLHLFLTGVGKRSEKRRPLRMSLHFSVYSWGLGSVFPVLWFTICTLWNSCCWLLSV
jgi:hypothetical protein